MEWLTALDSRLSRWAMYIACACLVGLLGVVVYGVVLRYIFNQPPAYVEEVALLLVISVAMFGASAGVRDATHIGMDSLVTILSDKAQFWCEAAVDAISAFFGLTLLIGGLEMATSTYGSKIPILGLPEATRYVPVIIGGVLIILFSIEHLIAQFTGKEVVKSWH